MKSTGTSVIFLNSSRQVLLMLRDDNQNIPFPNCWDLPGGTAEGDETPQECIRREMKEELEIDLEANPRLFRMYDLDDRREYSFWKPADLDIAALSIHEGQGLKWFSQEDILAMPDHLLAFGFKPIVLDFYREQPWLASEWRPELR